jgi:type I restriction enzyme, S subunit
MPQRPTLKIMKNYQLSISRYSAYKDSGVKWLGEVPEHWSLYRIKSLTKTKSGTTPQSGLNQYYDNGTHFWVRTTDLNNNKLYTSEYKVTDIALEHYNLASIPVKSVLLAMYGGMGTIGKNAILQEEVTINQSVCAILPNDRRFVSEYLWYYIQYFRPHWEIFADSARKDPNINQEVIKRLWVNLPPLPEQKAIAYYLDTKTAQIDRKIDLLTQKASLYGKLKQSLINESVTRGLDKTLPMKDSGIEWINKVPEHWEVMRVKDIGLVVLGKMLDNTGSDNKFYHYYLKSKNIGWLKVDTSSVEKMYFSLAEMKYCRLKYGDLLISEGGEVGKTSFWEENLDECYIQNSVQKITLYKKNYSRYFLYQSFLLGHIKYYDSIVNQVSIKHLTKEKLSRVVWLCLPLPEQKAIADYLDTKTAQIDQIIQTINTQIEKLKELRKTLINDVVTGKIKVIGNEQ